MGVTIRFAQQLREDSTFITGYMRFGTRTGKHGMPRQPCAFSFGLWDRFAAGTAQTLFAEYEGHTIAGMVLFAPETPYTTPMGHLKSNLYTCSSPNNLLMWESRAWAAGKGYEFLDQGRTARSGLIKCKPEQLRLPYYYSPHVAGLASTLRGSRKI